MTGVVVLVLWLWIVLCFLLCLRCVSCCAEVVSFFCGVCVYIVFTLTFGLCRVGVRVV